VTDVAKAYLLESLDAAQKGDRSAFDRVARAHRQEIVSFCVRFLERRDDAEDVAQEVFSHAWQHLAHFRREASFRTWLWEIARNRCLNHLRARKSLLNQRSRSLDSMAGNDRQETMDLPDPRSTPEETVLAAVQIEAIRAEIRAVATEKKWLVTDWELFLLRIENEIAYADFATRNGKDEAYWRNRWRDKIKPVLERVRVRMDSIAP
jgi:RNA polymerase sigma factor (sigma-70 family)